MIRAMFAVLAVLTFSNVSFAADPYSVHCTDSSDKKITLFFYPGEPLKMLAAFAQDEEGWPLVAEFNPASTEEIGTLTLPEGFGMYVGVAPDEVGTGLQRYILLPLAFNPYEFSAFHGSHLEDEPILLDTKVQMNCF